MGRQPFLTRLALGRSPFEPSASITKSSEYVQVDPSQRDVPLEARDSSSNRYVQLFDERGNAINPRAHEHGRRLRQAQNDVLSAIGVVERRRSPSDALPGAYEQRLEQLESEDSAGTALALTSAWSKNICTWWIGSLRDRILTFQLSNTLSFNQITTSLQPGSRTQLIYTGLVARFISTNSVRLSFYIAFIFRPLDRLLIAVNAPNRARQLARRWKGTIRTFYRLLVEVFFYPFAYHSYLQQLGLLPARPLMPPWRAFVPFSTYSPLRPLLPPSGSFLQAVSRLPSSIFSSPLLFVCLQHALERWIHAIVYEAVESSIIHPTNPDLTSPEESAKQRASVFLGLRPKSPHRIRNTINLVFAAFGWSDRFPIEPSTKSAPLTNEERQRRLSELIEIAEEIEGARVTDVSRLDVPMASATFDHNSEIPTNQQREQPVPTSPTVSDIHDDANDPTIRITSRERMVEMEVRFPAHIISSQNEIAENLHRDPGQYENDLFTAEDGSRSEKFHRVTQLSIEPAQMLGAICRSQIVGWAVLPLKLVTLRLVASHYLSSRQVNLLRPSTGLQHHQPVLPVSVFNMDVKSMGIFVSRIALCGAIEVAIDLGLWGLQWIAVTSMGKKHFGWGTL